MFSRLFYGWFVVAAAFAVMCVGIVSGPLGPAYAC